VPFDERFVVERLAASGGMGRVFRARDAETHESSPSRCSTLTPRRARAAVRSSVSLAKRDCSHRSDTRRRTIRGVRYDLARRAVPGDGVLDGETLAARLGRGPLSIDDALALAKRLASALASAHAVGVVHRDVKPSNVLLVDGHVEQAKIIDFGIARFAPLATDVTRPGGVLGTPGYMAPEQARALREIDARADVYALGCVLFRALTGRLPFEGDDALSVLAKILLERTPRLRT